MEFDFAEARKQIYNSQVIVKLPRLSDLDIERNTLNALGRKRRNTRRKHEKLNFDRLDDDLFFSMVCAGSPVFEPASKWRRPRKKTKQDPPENGAKPASPVPQCPGASSGTAMSTEECSNQVPVIVMAPAIDPPPTVSSPALPPTPMLPPPTPASPMPAPSIPPSPIPASPIPTPPIPASPIPASPVPKLLPPPIPQQPSPSQKPLVSEEVSEEKKSFRVAPLRRRLRVKTAEELGMNLVFVDEMPCPIVQLQPDGQNFLESAFSSNSCTSAVPPANSITSKKLDMLIIGRLYTKYLTSESQEKISCVARTLRDIERHNDEANKILDKVQKSKSSEAEKLMLRHQTYGEMKRKRMACATIIQEQLSFLNSVQDEELEPLLQFLFLSILKIFNTRNSAHHKKGTLFKTISKELCSCFETVEGANDRLSSVIKKTTFRSDVQELYRFLERNKEDKFFHFSVSEEVGELKKVEPNEAEPRSGHIVHISEVDATKCLPCGSHLLTERAKGKATILAPPIINRPNNGVRAPPVVADTDQQVLKYTLKLDGPTVTLHPEGTTAPLPLQNLAERTLPNGPRNDPPSYPQAIASRNQQPQFGSTMDMTASHAPFNSLPANITKTSAPASAYQDVRANSAPLVSASGGTLHYTSYRNLHPIYPAKNVMLTGRAKNNENQIPIQTIGDRPPVLKTLSTNVMPPNMNSDHGAELNRFHSVQTNGVLQQVNTKHKCCRSYCQNDATLICGGCSQTFYCCGHCQTSDWLNGHSRMCKPMNPGNNVPR